MSEEREIVERLRRFTANNADWPTILEAASEIERLREENRQLRERSNEAVIAWINETIKRAGEAHILKKASDAG